MQIKCENCGAYMTDLDEKCPNCSSINPNLNNSSSSNNITMKQPKIKKKKSVCFITFIILAVIAIIAGITTGPSSEYYISSSNNLFYYSGSDWWNYNTQDKDWNQYNGKLVNKRPLELKKDYRRYIDASAVAGILSIQDVDSVDIFRSHNYLDVHPQKPLETYYKKDGKIYYFLNDIYGSNYGTRDNTGWYYYDDINNSWEYYSSYDDKEKLGDLYYDPSDYMDYSIYTWDNMQFTNTIWYCEKVDADIAHDGFIIKSSELNSSSD